MSAARRETTGSLTVLVYGQRVGRLDDVGQGRVRFIPDTNWLQGEQHPPLGLAFLVDPRPRTATGAAPAWFENLLPKKGSRLRNWICRQRELRETDSLGLLAALGRDLPGAVELLGQPGDHRDPEAVEEEPPDLLRFSLAGAQLKLSMLLSGERFVFPARGQSGDWIVKIPGERFPELPEVEAATMAWARLAGLSVPDFQVLPIERLHGMDTRQFGTSARVFAIRRFDRSGDGRVHQEDFAQALDFRPENEYGDKNPGASYDGMATLVGDICLAEGQEDFVARLAFVVASGDDDAHLKNWSLQWGYEHRPWLSPCYDQVATISWPDFGWGRASGPTLALALGREKKFARLDRRCLQKFAARANIADGVEVFMEGLERARLAWPSVAEQAPQRMVDAIRTHWRRVPLLREAGPLG